MDGIICINKPAGMTSFDVVAHVRRILKTRKVGHSGTLDPNATGVLVVAVGKATKAIPFLGVEYKTYRAVLQLGIKTNTGDIWGATIAQSEALVFDEAVIKNALNAMVGPQRQRVPKVSAKRINGKKSYEYVFNGHDVEQLYTDICINSINFITKTDDTIEFEATVSNGTYIRTLCEDIAEALGTIGTMQSLVRTVVGPYTIDDCIELTDLTNDCTLISVKSAVNMPTIVNPKMEDYVKNGKPLQLELDVDEVLVDTGEYFAVYRREHDSLFKSFRGLW